MRKKLFRLLLAFVGALFIMMSMTLYVFAIDNPDNQVDFGTGTVRLYNIYEDVLEADDMLIVAEVMVDYASPPTDYTAEEAFIFELLDTDGTTTILATTLNEYGNRPISIYLTASQVTSLSLVSGTAYALRITSNPLITFGSPPPPDANRTRLVYLAGSDYIDQSGATDDNNPLRDGMIAMAQNIEDNDNPANDYIVTVQGIRYLTDEGGSIFLEGIPGLSTMCPILFQSALEVMSSEAPESTGAYALTLTAGQKWGATVATGLTNLGTFIGISEALAGSVVLFILVIAFAVVIYNTTESGVATLLVVASSPFLGAYLGLMPVALAFVFVVLVVMLGGFFFFSRGAL
jgi:hypothetical protein